MEKSLNSVIMASSDLTMDDSFQKLHVSLPFAPVRRQDVRDAPELTQLLVTLTGHVDETGTSRSLSAELQAERTRLSAQLRSYHEARLLHTLLEEMAVRPAETADSAADDQLRLAVSEGLSLAELHDSLALSAPATDVSDHRLLGLTPDQLSPTAQCRQTLARLPRALDRALHRLGRRCAAVVCPEMKDSSDVPSELCQLPCRLSELRRLRDVTSQQVAELVERRDGQLLRQSRLMATQLQMLLTLINKHKLEHKVDAERKTIDHLSGSIQGMLLKTRQLTLQIQVETYTESCLSALRAAARHLHTETAALDARLSGARRQLSANESAGPEFAALARRYRQVCREVDHQRWLIAEAGALGGTAETPS